MTDLKYPWWVRLGIWGSNSRSMISIMLWGCALFAAAIIAVEIIPNIQSQSPSLNKSAFWGFIFVLVGMHYYLCRRWIDKHGDWSEIKSQWIGGWVIAMIVVVIIAVGIIYPFIRGWMSAEIK